jgi:hypothetical protein
MLKPWLQAILSQFSHRKKKKTARGAEHEETANMDDSDDDEDREFEEAMVGLEDGLVGDEEPGIEEDSEEVAGDVEASDAAAVEDIISQAQLTSRLQELSKDDLLLGRKSIAKVCFLFPLLKVSYIYCTPQLRTLSNKIVNSPTIKEDLELSCDEAHITARLMIRDVSTRWNSTAELLQRALELKDALKILVVKVHHNKPRGVRLARFSLSEDEWVLLKQLSPLLEVCGPFIFFIVLRSHIRLDIPLCHKTNIIELDSTSPSSYPNHGLYHFGTRQIH